MNWHSRYAQQASWTRDLRAYLFERTGLKSAGRILEVGCGTGAVLSGIVSPASSHGLDIQFASLEDARRNAPSALLVAGDVLSLPYVDGCFDIAYCHFLLLWVADPLRAVLEMKRVTRPGGSIFALAEPDYSARLDRPEALTVLGKWQAQALQRQGADPSLGGKLGDLFFRAGVEIVETGTIQRSGEAALTPAERELEWAVLQDDLAGLVPDSELKKLKALDEGAWAAGERELYVPTYFAWGRKEV